MYTLDYLEKLLVLLFLELQLLLHGLSFFLQRVHVDLELLLNSNMLSDFSFCFLHCFLQHLIVLFENSTESIIVIQRLILLQDGQLVDKSIYKLLEVVLYAMVYYHHTVIFL